MVQVNNSMAISNLLNHDLIDGPVSKKHKPDHNSRISVSSLLSDQPGNTTATKLDAKVSKVSDTFVQEPQSEYVNSVALSRLVVQDHSSQHPQHYNNLELLANSSLSLYPVNDAHNLVSEVQTSLVVEADSNLENNPNLEDYPEEVNENVDETNANKVEKEFKFYKKDPKLKKKDGSRFKITEILRNLLKDMDLTPPEGWGTGSPEELESKLLPIIAEDKDLKAKVLSFMTLYISPAKKEYIFVKRTNDAKEILGELVNNSYLKPEYKKIVIMSNQKKEDIKPGDMDWIKDRVVDLCLLPVSKEYRKFQNIRNHSFSTLPTVLAAFACYEETGEAEDIESDPIDL